MGEASAKIQFTISPCPVCWQKFTVQDVKPDNTCGLVLRHDCSDEGPHFIVHGSNLRQVVQNWNKLIWRY